MNIILQMLVFVTYLDQRVKNTLLEYSCSQAHVVAGASSPTIILHWKIKSKENESRTSHTHECKYMAALQPCAIKQCLLV